MSKYIRKETKGQIIFVVLILLAIAIGLLWNEIEATNREQYKPDVSYPMTNVNISWQQTFHAGGWGETDAGC